MNIRNIIVRLLNRDTDVNARGAEGWTPLHLAAEEGRKDVAELLIAKGADMNARDAEGWTPLHWAAYFGHDDVVELLVTKGADGNAKNKWPDAAAHGRRKRL